MQAGDSSVGAAAVADIGGLLMPAAVSPADCAGSREQLAIAEASAIVSLASRAPSVHNSQPWSFRVRDDVLEVLADTSRQLHLLDPQGREMLISCGAAILGARLGMRSRGLVPLVRLRPKPEQPQLVAELVPAGRASLTRVEAEMIAALPHRHSHRGDFLPEPVAPRLVSALCTDAVAEGCELLLVASPELVSDLGRIVSKAAASQQARPQLQSELARWLRAPGDRARDGIPADARARHEPRDQIPGPRSLPGHGPWSSLVPDSRLPGRSFPLTSVELADCDYAAVTAVLVTSGDTPVHWLRAGQALHRLLLRAAARWVFAALQSEPLEIPRYRREVRSLLALDGYPQMLLQFGRANVTRPTPRRDVAELLVR